MKMEQIVSACRKLNELFRQIAQQLDQDRHAIHEIAERAKTAGGGIPVSRRYREVIEAYDQYILPMTEMMDSGPTGTFSAHMDKAIRTLEGGREKLLIQGALYRHQEQLNLVNGQAKELQRQGRLILKECSDTLLPLRDELRQHNTLSQSISYLLGQIRKRGLNKTLPEASLPLWQRDSERQIRINDKLLDYMAGAMCFTPQETPFPNDVAGDMPAPTDLINERELREILASDLPVADLLQWLHKRHPDLQDVTLLRLYHTLIHEDEHWTAYQSDSQQECPERPQRQDAQRRFGALPLAIPRDRQASFEPQIVGKHQTRWTGFDDKIISLYVRGLSVREIQGHLEEIYHTDVSPSLISAVTDAVSDEVKLWQSRPLDPIYPILYLDCIHVKVRDSGAARTKAVYMAIGVNMDGHKEVLGLWIAQTEGAKFWLQVVTELKNRGFKTYLSPAWMASMASRKPLKPCSRKRPSSSVSCIWSETA